MKKQRTDGKKTRERLLTAASEVFANKGFWKTTNADICKKANANTAAVNYHFGSKENLYIEAWKYAFEKSNKTHPPDGGVSAEATVEERLGGRILAFMQRIADLESHDFEITHQEMSNPTGLLNETMKKAVSSMEEGFKSIIQELLGGNASERQVEFCRISIMGQCFGPMMHLRKKKSDQVVAALPLDFDIEELAEHITQFSLAGINNIRRIAEDKRKKTKNR
jgi:AcrR family transcriptional regulator